MVYIPFSAWLKFYVYLVDSKRGCLYLLGVMQTGAYLQTLRANGAVVNNAIAMGCAEGQITVAKSIEFLHILFLPDWTCKNLIDCRVCKAWIEFNNNNNNNNNNNKPDLFANERLMWTAFSITTGLPELWLIFKIPGPCMEKFYFTDFNSSVFSCLFAGDLDASVLFYEQLSRA